MRRRRGRIFAACVVLSLALAAPPAQAAFHEILIREVYAGGAANDSYVVLQAYSGGQNFVGGHSVTAYDASGSQIGSFTFGGSVGNGQTQMTILVADTAYATTFPSGPAPDGTSANLNLSPAGGAACWAGLDCVSWGSFSGTTSPSSGSPATPAGVPASMALRRSIAPNCPTFLELADDTNGSAVDFSAQTPNPRSNASAIVEKKCVPPTTTIDSGPTNPTKATSASFTYHSTPDGASFECKLDAAAFAFCEASGIEYPGPLADGSHTFQVRAKDSNGTGAADSHSWKVDTVAPQAEIKTHPPDPSPGNSAAFTYASNETVPLFQCSLAPVGEPDGFSGCSPSGKSYPDAAHPGPLADGDWVFKVRATDGAGNQGAPDEFEWTVDNSLVDETPPQTTIESKPPDPSSSSTAGFTYVSSELGSSFECRLDGAAFADCHPAGVSYPGLSNGLHSFQVRAEDPSGNLDESPAEYSWTVAVPLSLEPPPIPPPSLPQVASRSFQALPPQTILTAKPGAVTRDRTPTFRFRSTVTGSSFECKLDRGRFRTCSSPFTTRKLSFGSHVVQIRARAAGLVDPTPAKSSFKVAKPARKRR